MVAVSVLAAGLASDPASGTSSPIELVSANQDGQPLDLGVFSSALSRDGRFVAFVTTSQNIAGGATDSCRHVYVKDRVTDSVEELDLTPAGDPSDCGIGNQVYLRPHAISADDRYVVFDSDSSDLTSQPVRTAEVYVADRVTGRVLLASSNAAGSPANATSRLGGISADGRFVVFSSSATNLDLRSANLGTTYCCGPWTEVYEKDLVSGAVELVSLKNSGIPFYYANDPVVSANGLKVAFDSQANCIPCTFINVTLRDLSQPQSTEVISQSFSGGDANGSSSSPVLSDDGSRLAFVSSASNIVPGQTPGQSWIFIHNFNADTTYPVTPDFGARVFSSDGRYLLGRQAVLDLANNAVSATIPDPGGGAVDISGDGRYVLFQGSSSSLPGSTPGYAQLYLLDSQPDGEPPSVVCGPAEPVWRSENISIGCTASDSGSGLADNADANFSLSSSVPAGSEDPAASTDSRRVCDAVGNCATAGPISGIKVDRKAPSTSDDAPGGWQNQPVIVHLTAQDGGSGVATTWYSLDGTPSFVSGNQVEVAAPSGHSNDGVHSISYYSIDSVGNVEPSRLTVIAIDTTPPAIRATRTPEANANGWTDADVTVTYTCSDAGSGVASCSTPATFGEGADQSVVGSARDNAGNSSSATVEGINVDKTPPTISGAPTTSANGAGWYNGDVTIHWTCSDGLSGIAGSCPGDDRITGEGTALTANESVADLAGNVAAATSAPVKIDRTPPVTTASAPSGWSNEGVTVTFSALDNLSGVVSTYYQIDAEPVQIGTSVNIDEEGVHTLTFWSSDRAGNLEAQKSMLLRIDKTAPTITHRLDPAPNSAGWNNGGVTVSFVCDDSLSGIALCTPSRRLTAEGQAQPVHGQAQDNAGNRADDTAFVSIDETPPTIRADTDRAANTYSWFNAPVKVSFSCSDTLSGVASCPAALTLVEGANQSAAGTAVDAAGNGQSTTLSNINIDVTAPVVSYSGNAGAYAVDQTVNITCSASDALSGIASTTCSNITGPAWSFGLGTTSRSASATDRAGNTATASTSFTIIVTTASLDNLITQFFGGDQNGASGLIAKADAIGSASNANARNGALGAFDNQVDAKVGNPLTPAQAALLKQLAATL
jgi:hypothetical protein